MKKLSKNTFKNIYVRDFIRKKGYFFTFVVTF